MNEDRNHNAIGDDTPAYHDTRPAQARSVYSDAYYSSVPQSGRASYGYNPARGYPDPDCAAHHRGQIGLGGILALCLICVLVASAVGIGGMYVLFRDRLEPQMTQAETVALTDFYARARQDQESAVAMPLSTSSVSAGATPLTAEEIYPIACRQVVGVTVSETVYNIFGQASGSGVVGTGVILSQDGYIVTNYHVIQNAYSAGRTITAVMYDGTEYEAQVVGVEPDSDLVVLKIDATGLEPAALGDSDSLIVGQTIYAVGNPLGELTYTMTSGIVSALDRRITTDKNVTVNMFQFDAAVNNGNSGGPLYNAYGQVVGIVTAKFSADGMEGLGFAIPISDACYIANELITRGYVPGKAYLGLSLSNVSASVARYFNMVPGVYINGVEEGSCSQEAGLRRGDIITAVDDIVVKNMDDMVELVRQYRAGDSAKLTVYRDQAYISVTVVFDEALPAQAAEGGGASVELPAQDRAPVYS